MKIDEERKDREARKAGMSFAASAPYASLVVLAAFFLAVHLPYLPKSLEDLDSINFALGLRQFDVAQHQPHPPGYPVYVVVASIVRGIVRDEARALGLVSVVAGTLGVLAIGAFFLRLERLHGSSAFVPATALAMTAPLYYFTAVRPLSDMAGLAAAVAIQTLTIGASTIQSLSVAAFCAGLATGIRSQVFWLTAPLIAAMSWRVGARGSRLAVTRASATSPQPSAPAVSAVRAAGLKSLAPAAFFIAGVLVWAIPLVVVTGGPAAYWHALFDQGTEDLGNIQMLWTRHGVRDVADALYYAFIAPWAVWPVASIVLVCAALGMAWLWRRARLALLTIAVAFGPYLVFDILFQETFTSRYALPLVVPLAYLAAAGLRWAPREAAWLLALPIIMYSTYVGGTSIAAYAQQKAPAFRLLDDMKRAAESTGQRPVLAPDRRQSLDLRRPIRWMDAAMPPIVRQLPAPPQHEWLQAVDYWNSGRIDPVWFLVDPRRSAINLVQHPSPFAYRWPLPYPVLMSGVRPNDVDWYAVDRPEWYVGEGWALTPEAAGVADADHRGPSRSPISAWIRRDLPGGVLMVGGRSFDATSRPKLTVELGGDERPVTSFFSETLSPGPFLRLLALPSDVDFGRAEYGRLNIRADVGSTVAIEQFDVSRDRPILGFGEGWHELEFNPRTGVQWRWLSERGELPFRSPTPSGLSLHVEGESPIKYFSRGSRLTVRVGDRVVFNQVLSSDFALTIPLPEATEPLVLETDQTYVPAERGWRRTADRRHLGLRIFKCELRRGP